MICLEGNFSRETRPPSVVNTGENFVRVTRPATTQLNLLSPLQLYFNPNLIVGQLQVWRLITTFLFFGNFSFNFFFNMIFTYKYCRMLEEGSFHGRTADFVMMFIFGIFSMLFFALFVNQLLLGPAFTLMFVYVWSRSGH